MSCGSLLHTNNRRNILIKSTPLWCKRKKRPKNGFKKIVEKKGRIKGVCTMMGTDHLQMLSLFFDSPDEAIILPFTYIYTTFKKGPTKAPSIFVLIRLNVKFCLPFWHIIVLTRTPLHSVHGCLTISYDPLPHVISALFCKQKKILK